MPRPRPSAGLSSALRGDRVRAAALEVLAAVLEEGQLADRALSRVLRRERKLLSGERRAVAETIYGLLRREAALRQALVRALGTRSIESFPASAIHATLLFGHLQLEGERLDLKSVSGLPAPLQRALESLRAELTAQLAQAGSEGSASRLALEHSLPAWLAEQLVTEVGAPETERLFAALNRRAPLTLRTNLLRTTREALLDRLAALDVPSHPTPLSPWGVKLEQNPNVFGLEPFREGWFEVQDEGSQLLALLCRARPGKLVVDACAGGGGKTLALAAEMHNRGELWALDVNARRLAELKPRARRAGAHNIRSLVVPEAEPEAQAEPAAFAKLAGRADVVLVDAPCSGIGALRRNPDARRRLTAESIDEHAVRQLQILKRVAPLVRPGGLLVYATCSVLRAEDERVAAAFLVTDEAFAPVSPRDLLGEELAAAIDEPLLRASAGARAEGLRSPNALRLWPQHHGTDGFFAMAMRRR